MERKRKKVINAYYTVFFYMIKNIYDEDVNDSVNGIKDLLTYLKFAKNPMRPLQIIKRIIIFLKTN